MPVGVETLPPLDVVLVVDAAAEDVGRLADGLEPRLLDEDVAGRLTVVLPEGRQTVEGLLTVAELPVWLPDVEYTAEGLGRLPELELEGRLPELPFD